MEIENVPLEVGMPLSCPCEKVKPGGSVPVYDNVYGATPPVPVRI
jgi:hypothetical protein